MNRERAKELLPIIQAFAEGEIVEYRYPSCDGDHWSEWDKTYFEMDEAVEYRIKPEPEVIYVVCNAKSGAKTITSHPEDYISGSYEVKKFIEVTE